jgi:hypothetical protein
MGAAMGKAKDIAYIGITCLGLKRIALANNQVFLAQLLEMAAMEATKIDMEIYFAKQEESLNQR